MSTVIVPVGLGDTAETLGARYTIGGAAYGPAIISFNGAWQAAEGEIGSDVPLAALGITSAAIPSNWLRPGAQVQGGGSVLNSTVAGVPVWALAAFAVLILAMR